jgi:small subunit ribosomal protein S27Ae
MSKKTALKETTETPQPKTEKTEKKEKKPKEEKGVHALYMIETGRVTRLRPVCERCGPGYFMAEHANRYTCGHCGFTKYKRLEK